MKEEIEYKDYICYAINGYSNDLVAWLDFTIIFFSREELSLKSVTYDVNRTKLVRKSLKTFRKDQDLDVRNNYSFTVFTGEKQNIPRSWQYGVNYDTMTKSIIMFFDRKLLSEEKIMEIYKRYLTSLLKDQIVNLGYLYDQNGAYHYSQGGMREPVLYKEDSHRWWQLYKPQHLDLLFNLKGYFRHIYLQNIINEHHMDIIIDKLVFPEWVEKSESGTICKIGKKNWLWVVPEEKAENLEKIMLDNGLLIGVTKNGAFDAFLEEG